jgi:tetratricopeptide (TPR) repeat protein
VAFALAQAGGGKATGDLGALVDYSLVEALPGGLRLRLHPQLREYAAEQLALLSTEMQDRLGDAALAWWIAYAQAHPGYEGMDVLEAEGLMGAIAWAHDHQRSRPLLWSASALLSAWDTRGRRNEEPSSYGYSLDAAAQLCDQQQRWATHQLAVTLQQTGKIGQALAGYEEALRLARELGDKRAIRAELHDLAVRDDDTGNNEAAEAGYRSALDIARELGDPAAEVADLRDLGELLARTRDPAGGRALIKQAITIFEQLNDPVGLEFSYTYLGRLDRHAGRRDEAIQHYRMALRYGKWVQSLYVEEARQALRALGATPYKPAHASCGEPAGSAP